MYCDQDNISPAKLSEQKLSELTSDEPNTIDDDVVEQAIIDADSDIDGYAGRRYVVPFDPVPEKVRQLSVAIAVYKLYERRIDVVGEIPKSVRDMYDDAMRFLKDVSRGDAVIDGAITPSQHPARTGGSVSSKPRVFGADSLDKL